MTETFDVLIVGGGSAGAVLANRLSEDGPRRKADRQSGYSREIKLIEPLALYLRR